MVQTPRPQVRAPLSMTDDEYEISLHWLPDGAMVPASHLGWPVAEPDSPTCQAMSDLPGLWQTCTRPAGHSGHVHVVHSWQRSADGRRDLYAGVSRAWVSIPRIDGGSSQR